MTHCQRRGRGGRARGGPRQPSFAQLSSGRHDGVLKVFVDDDLVLEESLESRIQEDLIVVKVRRGQLRKAFDVRPGYRNVRLEVVGEGFSGARRIDGRLERGETRRLEVRLGGLIKKELTAWWSPPLAPEVDR